MILPQTIEGALNLNPIEDQALKAILGERTKQLAEPTGTLRDSTFFVVVEIGDRLDALEHAIGFPVVTDHIDGIAYRDPDFTPSWEWCEDHGSWFELVFIFTDDGFAHVLFVPDDEGVDAELLAMCREHCRRAVEQSAVDPPPDLIDPTEL